MRMRTLSPEQIHQQANQRRDARATLEACGVPIGADFHTLRSDQVCRLIEAADKVRYRKPKAANGSRGRYFHALLQRRAAPPSAFRGFV